METTPDARILGWLLATQNVLQALPSGRKQGEFVAAALKEIPGVSRAGICFCGSDLEPCDGTCPAIDIGSAEQNPNGCSGSDLVTIPLRTAGADYGRLVLKLDDPDTFAPYEPIVGNYAGSLALLLENLQQKTELESAFGRLSASEERYRQLFTEMNAGLAVHEILLDEQGRPCDYRFLELNPAFERLTGMRAAEVEGKRVLEVLPQLERSWIERYGHVALTGEPCQFEDYNRDLGRYYSVVAYRPRQGQFAVVFTDVTQHKRLEEKLRAQHEELLLQNEYLEEARAEAARLFEKQRAMFVRLQEALLDVPQQMPGVKFGHIYRSATEEDGIGGDFYDIFETKDGLIGIVIGDVCGHGVDAARLATLVKDSVHAFAHQFSVPHHVLRETNRLLLEKKIPGFVTAFLGFLDPNTGVLTYCSAGHPAPVFAEDGSVTLLESRSTPLGIFFDARYSDGKIAMKPGETVVLYTDGITEARVDGRFFGENGLLEAVRALVAWPTEKLPALLLERALAFSDGHLRDDVAVLALSYTGKPAG